MATNAFLKIENASAFGTPSLQNVIAAHFSVGKDLKTSKVVADRWYILR